ncbi:MAG: transglycosylase SLT domain-containing protein [Chloroflexota bacterium]
MTERYLDSPEFEPPEAAQGAGCCTGYALPPLVILVIAAAVLAVAFRNPNSFPIPATGGSAARASSLPSQISGVFTPEVQYWGSAIAGWAADAGLDPNLAAVVMQIESCGDPRALSRAGAIGLFQVMPYHFEAAEQPYSTGTNAARGLAYLSRALSAAEGDARVAFAGYNGGIGVIGRPESTWPAETVRYAYWGSGVYADARSGSADSARLSEWLAAGGTSLCRAARQRLNLSE